MKKLTIAIVSFLISIASFSQPAELVIKNGMKGLYLEHKVAPKEGLFPLGRMYNVHPRHIATFNGIDFNKGLAIGQKINIPLTDTNFSQKVFEGVPVLYKTIGKESLANISVKYKSAINNLRVWNHLSSDDISAGTKLIIGFLITNEMQNRVVKINQANNGAESVSNVKKQESSEKKQPQIEVKKDTVIVEESVSNVKKQESSEKKLPQPEVKKDTVAVEESVSNVKKQESSEKKLPQPEVKKDTVAVEESVSNVKKQESSEKKLPQPEVKKDTVAVEESVSNVKKQESSEKKQPQAEVKKDTVVVEESVSNVKKQETLEKKLPVTEIKNEVTENKKTDPVKPSETINDNGTGYFKNYFYQQVKTSPLKKEQTVTSSIFKTTSGWQDAKYYLLINGIEPGTIVKITNPSNNKTIFAKVLYAMDKIRENQGVDMRISDAAASTLAVTETDKFILKVNY